MKLFNTIEQDDLPLCIEKRLMVMESHLCAKRNISSTRNVIYVSLFPEIDDHSFCMN